MVLASGGIEAPVKEYTPHPVSDSPKRNIIRYCMLALILPLKGKKAEFINNRT